MSDHISENADIGAARFLPHDNLEVWADQIKRGAQPDAERVNQNLERYSVENYLNSIKNIYELP